MEQNALKWESQTLRIFVRFLLDKTFANLSKSKKLLFLLLSSNEILGFKNANFCSRFHWIKQNQYFSIRMKSNGRRSSHLHHSATQVRIDSEFNRFMSEKTV